MSRRYGALGAITILVVLALGVSNASAASLAVIAGRLGTFKAPDRCATGPLAATVSGTPTGGNYTQVTISSVPSACNGTAIRLTVFGASGAALATSAPSATAATGTTTVTMATAYSGAAVLGAALTLGGYGVPTTWTGPSSGKTCTAALAVRDRWPGGFTIDVTVTAGVTAITSWSTSFSLPAGATITNLWAGSWNGSGPPFVVTNLSYNGALGAGASTTYGFNGSGTAPTGSVAVSCTAG